MPKAGKLHSLTGIVLHPASLDQRCSAPVVSKKSRQAFAALVLIIAFKGKNKSCKSLRVLSQLVMLFASPPSASLTATSALLVA